MDNQQTAGKETLNEKLYNLLKKTQTEIEELTLQFSLGKAEASDTFENVKQDFLARLKEWKPIWGDLKESAAESMVNLRTKFEELQVQLSLGKAEAREKFEEQQKQILRLLQEMENELKSNPTFREYYAEYRIEAEKLRLKLDILKLKFELKKIEVKDIFKDELNEAKNRFDHLYHKAQQKFDNAKSSNQGFIDEMEETWKHLRNAVRSL